MKKYLLPIALLRMATATHAQSRADYNAAVSKFQTFYNANQKDSIFNQFSDRIKLLMPADKTAQMMAQLSTRLGAMGSYEFTKEEPPLSYYKTTFKNGTVSLILSLSKDNKFESFRFVPYEVDAGPNEKSNFTYAAPTGSVYGSLTMPVTDNKVPVVLVIAGSGPTDRNGNQAQMKSNAYKLIADSLLKAGIACLRYDKRGIGESVAAAKSEESTRFDDMADDAAGIIKMLKGDSRFSKVYVLGHSEGSLVGMIAAKKEPVSGFISLAGAGQRADKIIEQQLATQSKEGAAVARVIMDSLVKGYKVRNVDTALMMLFRPSVQPYLTSWFTHDPQAEINKVAAPILILQGTTDIQVAVSEAEMLKKANPKATLKLVRGMNHVLKQAPADREQNVATYNNAALPLSAGLMEAILKFINATK